MNRVKGTAPAPTKMHNLVQYFKGAGDVVSKVATPLYNVPYGMCKALKNKLEAQKHPTGTYFTIEPN